MKLYKTITIQLKRFILFAGSKYYPAGGMEDFESSFDTLQEAIEYAQVKSTTIDPHFPLQEQYDWFNILDTVTGETYNTINPS